MQLRAWLNKQDVKGRWIDPWRTDMQRTIKHLFRVGNPFQIDVRATAVLELVFRRLLAALLRVRP